MMRRNQPPVKGFGPLSMACQAPCPTKMADRSRLSSLDKSAFEREDVGARVSYATNMSVSSCELSRNCARNCDCDRSVRTVRQSRENSRAGLEGRAVRPLAPRGSSSTHSGSGSAFSIPRRDVGARTRSLASVQTPRGHGRRYDRGRCRGWADLPMRPPPGTTIHFAGSRHLRCHVAAREAQTQRLPQNRAPAFAAASTLSAQR